jgi:hypothetical protein
MLRFSLCAVARGIACRLFLVLLLAPALYGQAKPVPDVLVFKNGDRLTGRLLHGVGNTVVFKSDMAGEITVSLDDVATLHVHGDFAVLRKNQPIARKTVVPSGPITYADATVTVSSPGTAVPEADLAFVVDRSTFDAQRVEPKPWRGWGGGATAGVTSVQSTNYGTTFNLGLNLVRTIPAVAWLPPRNRSTFHVAETYGKLTQPVVPQTTPVTPNSVARTNIFHSDFEHDRYLHPRFYTLGDLSFDHNYAQGLSLQQVYGAGFGWTPFSTPQQQLDLKADVHYESQSFQPTSTATQNQNLAGSTFAESYRRLLPRKIVLTESASVLPAWNNANAYSANGSVNLNLPTFKRLSVGVGASDSFLNDPPAGYQKNSFQFFTNLGYTF